MNIEKIIIQRPYSSRSLNANPGKIKDIKPPPIVAPQTGAPITQDCNAPKPKIILRIPRIDAPEDFAE
jgi:hypothetical protein